MPTIKDVAKRAGVSPMTVSRVLNNASNVKPSTREKVLEAVEELGYIPSGVAKAITESIGAATIGCGGGPHVDGHNLNGYDILGLFEKFVPKFVKQYKLLAPEIIEGYNAFTEDVRSGNYPAPEYCFTGGDQITQLYPTDLE